MATRKKPAVKKKARSKQRAKKKVEAVPSRYGTATPHLIVSPAKKAMHFYEAAFGAKDLGAMTGPDGLVLHGEFKVGGSIVMYSDELPPMPGEMKTRKTPKHLGGTSGGVMTYVKDVDAFYARAVRAGATGAMPPADMFWGDRYAQVVDPFGHVWAMATHTRDVTRSQMAKAMEGQRPPT